MASHPRGHIVELLNVDNEVSTWDVQLQGRDTVRVSNTGRMDKMLAKVDEVATV